MSLEFDVILADPPWTFSTRGKPSSRHVSNKYDLMTCADICKLPVQTLAAENCVLFLWATWPNILEAFQVIDSWGFTYRTKAWTWVKAKRNGLGFHFGMGYYTRANDEPCLLAVKGTMPVSRHDIQSLIYHPVMAHSRKPDDQYRKIEALYPNMRYLELFARRKRPGWNSWGNEIESDIDF